MNASPSGRTAFRGLTYKHQTWKANTSSSAAWRGPHTIESNFPYRRHNMSRSLGGAATPPHLWTIAGLFMVAFVVMSSLFSRRQKHRAPSFGWRPETVEKLKVALLQQDVIVGMCWDEELLGQVDWEKFAFGGKVTITLTAIQQNFVLWGDEEVLEDRQITIWIHPIPTQGPTLRHECEDGASFVEETLPPPSTVSPSDGSRDWVKEAEETPAKVPLPEKATPPAVIRYQSLDSSIATRTINTDFSFSASIISSVTSNASEVSLLTPMEKLKPIIPILADSPIPSPTSASSSPNGEYVHPDQLALQERPSWKRAREDAIAAAPFTGFPYPAIDNSPYAPAEPSLGQRQCSGELTASHGDDYINRITKESYGKFERRVGYELLKGGLDSWDAGYRSWSAFEEEPSRRGSKPRTKIKMLFSDRPLYEEPKSM